MILVKGNRERRVSGKNEFCIAFSPVSGRWLDKRIHGEILTNLMHAMLTGAEVVA
jgi:hypothetical protein